MTLEKHLETKADKALKAAAVFWFFVAVIGQWLFVYYIAVHYGGGIAQGDFEAWKNTSIKGHVDGDISGNFFFITHVLMAAIITFGGTLQLVPQIRERAINFHRWNGRLFILMAFVMSLGGLYLVWVRGAVLAVIGGVGTSLNAILIMIFAFMAVQKARKYDLSAHRRWALRTFLMVNGVWFFRVGFMAWILINQAPVGSTENPDGPFDIIWAFANFLLPLAVLEIYFYTQKDAGSVGKFVMAAGLFTLSLLMAVGIFGAYLMMWSPNF
ncbi:MAG: DUF2306 domain-containing protein [Pyrinomonadaceae bacterium]|nr:DUF2306 domain-containing protein [Pyrinomonadaceae bacterium]